MMITEDSNLNSFDPYWDLEQSKEKNLMAETRTRMAPRVAAGAVSLRFEFTGPQANTIQGEWMENKTHVNMVVWKENNDE